MKFKKSSLINTFLLLFILPLLIIAAKKIVDIRKGASGTLANIVVNTKSLQGAIPSALWQNLSQGGEEPTDMIKPVIPLLRQIEPKLIRIDHLFDYFQVYRGDNNYDFSKLDQAVESILLTGAKPMLSISYTTNEMAANGQNAGEPKDWNQWYQLVKATANHYSIAKKIDGIYYEIWNEPDLFGGWKYNRSPNYSILYIQSAKAIVEGAKGANYKVGGPAITAYYSNWIKSLFATASNNRVPLDFVSWHKYTKDMDEYEKDFNNLNSILADYPQYFNIERVITEAGPNPEPDTWYDNSLSGIHLIALSTRMAGKIHRLFVFEPVDGPTRRSDVSSGWGLITHSNNGLKPKPRYYAIQFLNLLKGIQLSSEGDGSWVSSLSSKNGETIQTLLVNYDPRNSHDETFPITFQNLTPGNYILKTTSYLGKSSTKKIITTANYRDQIYLEANSAILLELSPIK